MPQFRSGGRQRTAGPPRAWNRIRLQDHQDESGREKGRLEHQGRGRGSVAPGSRVLQASGLFHQFDNWRTDLVETGGWRKQLSISSRMFMKAAEMAAFLIAGC